MRLLHFSLAIAVLTALLPSTPVQAQVRAQIYLTQQRIPRGLSERALVRWARGHRATRLMETTEGELDDREWKSEMIVQFNRPPDDLEFQIVFYDTQDGAPRYVTTMPIYVSDRTQSTYVQRIRLPRPEFTPNRRMELVITIRRQEAGRLAFQVLGEEHQNSGQVDFSDSDTRQPRAEPLPEEAPIEDPPPPMDDENPQLTVPPPARLSGANRSSGGCAVGASPNENEIPFLSLAALGLFLLRRREPLVRSTSL